MSMTMVPRSVMKNVGKKREREKNEKKEQVKVVTHFTRSGSLEVSIRRTTISGRHI